MRCHIDPSEWALDEILLSVEESHHLLHVLRARTGQEVALFDGQGGEAVAEYRGSRKGRALLAVRRRSRIPPPDVTVELIQAVPREQKMDLIVQKATELGVGAIRPVITEHAVVRLTGERARGKKERWEKIALNAAKQCGTAWLPRIDPPRDLSALLAERPAYGLFLVCALAGETRPLREVLGEARGRRPATVGVVVGPEGDLTPDELAGLRAAGAVPVGLGDSVLRAETAALYVLSALRYEFGSARP